MSSMVNQSEVDSISMEVQDNSLRGRATGLSADDLVRHSFRLKLTDFWSSWGVASVIVLLALGMSPSYSPQVDARLVAPGSDFLQEWIGGYIVRTTGFDRLYDWNYAKELQHDHELIGCTWPSQFYYPMVYPPLYYWAMQPFSLVSPLTAARIWCCLIGVCLAFALQQMIGFLRTSSFDSKSPIGFQAIPLLALMFGPVLLSFNMGQKSTLILLLFATTFSLLYSERPIRAGLLFSLIIFKPHFAIPFVVHMTMTGRWRFLAGFLTGATLCTGFSFAICGSANIDYLRFLMHGSEYLRHAGYTLFDSHNLWVLLNQAFVPVTGSIRVGIYLMFAAALFAILLHKRPGTDSANYRLQKSKSEYVNRPWWEASMICIATILLSPHLFTYDLTLMLIPISVSIISFANRNNTRSVFMELSEQSAPSSIVPYANVGLAVGFLLASQYLPAMANCLGFIVTPVILTAWLIVIRHVGTTSDPFDVQASIPRLQFPVGATPCSTN